MRMPAAEGAVAVSPGPSRAEAAWPEYEWQLRWGRCAAAAAVHCSVQACQGQPLLLLSGLPATCVRGQLLNVALSDMAAGNSHRCAAATAARCCTGAGRGSVATAAAAAAAQAAKKWPRQH